MTEFDNSDWDVTPDSWSTAEAYSSDCLIDENEGEEKLKEKSFFPFRKEGADFINKNALKTIANDLADSPVSEEKKVVIAKWVIKNWKQAFMKPAPKEIYELAGENYPESSIKVFEDKAGTWFLGMYSNKYIDRHDEILSEKSHDNFVAWAKETGVKPPIVFSHLPKVPEIYLKILFMCFDSGLIDVETYNNTLYEIYNPFMIAKTVDVFVSEGFALVLGKVCDDKREVAKKLNDYELGMSHGFIPISKSDNIINDYRTIEFTVAPSEIVANLITFGLFSELKDIKTMDNEQKQLLMDLFGEESVTNLDETLKRVQSILKNKGILSKIQEIEIEDEPDEVVEEPVNETNPQIEELNRRLDEISTRLETILEKTAELVAEKTNEDTVIADSYTVAADLEEVDEAELIEKLKEEVQVGTEEDNPLNFGLYRFLSK